METNQADNDDQESQWKIVGRGARENGAPADCCVLIELVVFLPLKNDNTLPAVSSELT